MFIGYYNDGKEKFQSCEISLNDEYNLSNLELSKNNIISLNPFDNYGYGKNKEEAFEDFKSKYFIILNELIKFGDKLKDASSLSNSELVRDVDCFGKEIQQ